MEGLENIETICIICVISQGFEVPPVSRLLALPQIPANEELKEQECWSEQSFYLPVWRLGESVFSPPPSAL